MAKFFNVNGLCRPEKHYMVDISSRLEQIKRMVDNGDYFTINRGRQYGKTTTLNALAENLKKFNFNKKKQIRVQEITLGDKVLVEAVV